MDVFKSYDFPDKRPPYEWSFVFLPPQRRRVPAFLR